MKPFSKIFTGHWMIIFVAASGWLQLGLKDLGIHTGDPYTITDGAVRRMRTHIRLLAQPESMRSIVGATQ